ncbi:hypothetical protein H311_01715 [Anncaliia algerae PRA109]|nr:hypothetical protein H311_01715 [Anncaliia algerae PRA109]
MRDFILGKLLPIFLNDSFVERSSSDDLKKNVLINGSEKTFFYF